MNTVIADYSMGNLASIANMVSRVGGSATVSAAPEVIACASKLILPGVGAFDHGISSIRERELELPIRQAIANGASVLGICLGMQMMMRKSEEGRLPGLGLIEGEVKRFPSGEQTPRVPHMGWSGISVEKRCVLLPQSDHGLRYYFAHSYYVNCEDPDDLVATASHGLSFSAVIQKGNCFGVQFHPEKSHRFGMDLIQRFLAI